MTDAATPPPRRRPFYQLTLMTLLFAVPVLVDLVALLFLRDIVAPSHRWDIAGSFAAMVAVESIGRYMARKGRNVLFLEPAQYRLSTLCGLLFAAALLLGVNSLPLRTIEAVGPDIIILNGQPAADKVVCYGFPATHYRQNYLKNGTPLPSQVDPASLRMNAQLAVAALILLGVFLERRAGKLPAPPSPERSASQSSI